MSDLFSDKHILAAIYFTDLGQYLFKSKKEKGGVVSKSLAEPVVSAAFSHRSFDSGWLGAGVVRMGEEKKGKWLVYFHPACIHEITIGKKTLTIPLPATVLMQIGNGSYLFATKGNEFKPDEPAYKAPFANVNDNGQICWGENKAPKADPAKATAIWEMFFRSPFNNDLSNGKSKKSSDKVNVFLKTLAGKKKYPTEDLEKMYGSLETVIERLIEQS